MVEVRTSRLLLRPWREDDLDPYARMCADPEVMRYIGGGAVLTRGQAEEQISRFVRHWEERGYGLWVVEEKASGAFAGFVGLFYHDDWPEGDHKTEVGWRLDRSFWSKGYATEGATASVRHGFEELELERIISIIQPANAASRRVAEKVGLTRRGATRWRGHETDWYALDRPDWEAIRAQETSP